METAYNVNKAWLALDGKLFNLAQRNKQPTKKPIFELMGFDVLMLLRLVGRSSKSVVFKKLLTWRRTGLQYLVFSSQKHDPWIYAELFKLKVLPFIELVKELGECRYSHSHRSHQKEKQILEEQRGINDSQQN